MRRTRWAALLALLLPRAAGAEPAAVGTGDEPRWNASTRPDSRALGGGLFLFGLGYGGALALGAQEGFASDSGLLAIPVAGPWLTLWDGSEQPAWTLTMDGIAQFGGAVITSIALAYPVEVLGPAKGGADAPTLSVALSAPHAHDEPWSVGVNGAF